ncbi:class IV adenylate cyclase [Candidatus Woesearchaeota archaeon]|nr:class IV adenylate cyclase [Candidatus Woesearchaeota archaeon]
MYELEVKHHVDDLHTVEERVRDLGGVCNGTRQETNRFYALGGWLIRLRDDPAEITLKGPAKHGKVRECLELNCPVPRWALPALGLFFSFGWRYDKERTTYEFRQTEVALDTLEFGTFVEVEGSIDEVVAVERALGLNSPVKETYSQMARWKHGKTRVVL